MTPPAGPGPERTVTATTTAQRNSTALAPGKYGFSVQGAPCFLLQGTSTVTATTTTADRTRDGQYWIVTVPDFYDADTRRAFVSILAESGTPTVRVTQLEAYGAAPAQPSAWA